MFGYLLLFMLVCMIGFLLLGVFKWLGDLDNRVDRLEQMNNEPKDEQMK